MTCHTIPPLDGKLAHPVYSYHHFSEYEQDKPFKMKTLAAFQRWHDFYSIIDYWYYSC